MWCLSGLLVKPEKRIRPAACVCVFLDQLLTRATNITIQHHHAPSALWLICIKQDLVSRKEMLELEGNVRTLCGWNVWLIFRLTPSCVFDLTAAIVCELELFLLRPFSLNKYKHFLAYIHKIIAIENVCIQVFVIFEFLLIVYYKNNTKSSSMLSTILLLWTLYFCSHQTR